MLRQLISFLLPNDRLYVPRVNGWPRLRADFLRHNPACAVCGGIKKVTPHHIRPVHLWPELELAWDNLIPLCEANGCHYFVGHLRNWRSFNPSVRFDAAVWRERFSSRPYLREE